ncbi:cellulase family glycosylhydrolase [Sphingobium sp. EP60837]|uniref:cellulase family glycosylhydrolase n=1 Tax=Sphingobium sp. EP60837 TaxID=1855519 RepID=UPI0007DD76B0|nr:cellulase family glycosylhydrolase [Sphingobium sp. EP60837]ANI80015.1 Endoglycosylceramidase [Sphingobium sp. EP60837]
MGVKILRMKAAVSFSCVTLAVGLSAPAPAKTADMRIEQRGRWFVDQSGRVITFHGGNVTLPEFDKPQQPRWTAETPVRMAEQGFNGVRLVIFFSRVMPQPGQIDQSYLNRIAKAVAAYKAAGIHTLIDFHQDQYSEKVGVRGMPDWAVFSDGYSRMPGVEFPIGYFKDPAVQRSFDNFWKNHPVPGMGKGVQDLYVEGLAAVARRFRDEPAVMGIDIFNEPATGSRCAEPDPAKANCPELEQQLLKPFYEKAAQAISRAAPRMIIFVEPFMLQGALGTPINTPIAGPSGRRALSFHNYGPVKATRDRVNDGALAHVIRSDAAIINTEWGFSNDPAEIVGQAADFDARHISWLAWTRGSFEALVDPKLPNVGNGNRVAQLRAYARPFAEATAGTPVMMSFDPDKAVLTYRYRTQLGNGRRAAGGETEIRIPAIHYPNGYKVAVVGGKVRSAAGAPLLRVRNDANAQNVIVTVSRVGVLPPLPPSEGEPDRKDAGLRTLPPIPAGPLTRRSLIGHIVVTPGGRALLDREVPGMLQGLSHVSGWERMTFADIQRFASGTLTEEKLRQIEADLATLHVTPGPVQQAGRLSIDSMTSDLIADPRARAILDREAPGLTASGKQGLFPQTRLRNLQPELPGILTPSVLARIEQALAALK